MSEWVRPRPNAGVAEWLSGVDEDGVFISVVTLAELRHGIERLPPGQRRRRLDAWLRDEVSARFAGRILPLDAATLHAWAQLSARAELDAQRLPVMDGLIMATAQCHGLTVVTRNTADFRLYPQVFDPWQI